MSNLIQMLEQLATSTQSASQRTAEVNALAAQHRLSAELTAAIQQADLAGLVRLAGAAGHGCFVIVAPDDQDEPQDQQQEQGAAPQSH